MRVDSTSTFDSYQTRTGEISREGEFVLACVQAQLSPQKTFWPASRAVVGNVSDWNQARVLAEQHGAISLCYHALKSIPPDELQQFVPSSTLDLIRDHFHGNTIRSLTLGAELTDILSCLDSAGVDALPVKGVAFAALAYPEPTQRQPGDIDLLIHPRDYRSAVAALTQLGYAARTPKLMSARQEDAWLYFKIERHFYRTDPYLDLDLHWQLFERRILAFDFDDLWQRGAVVRTGRGVVRTLGVEDALLYACFHGSKHGWDTLKWLVDVAALLVRHPDLDWDVLLARAEMLGGRRMLLSGLAVVHDFLAADLPPDVLGKIEADALLPALVDRAHVQLFSRLGATHSPGRRVMPRPKSLLEMRALNERYRHAPMWVGLRLVAHQESGVGHQIRQGLASIITPGAQELQLVSLPKLFFPLYYVLRLLRILWRIPLALLRLFS